MSEQMRAAWYMRQGPASEVLTVGERERPEPGPGEVRLQVHASGVNPSDTYGRAGTQRPMAFPWVIPHQDGAGVIDAVGEGVSPVRIGQRVWVYESTWGRAWGTAAEYTLVDARKAIALPADVTFEEGACLGVPYMTAHRAVFADGPVTGATVLVTGGAGAVGHYAIQLARWGGARVISTVSSAEKADAARSAGAEIVVNYRSDDVVAAVLGATNGQGADRIVEVDLGGNLEVSVQVLRARGTIASYASRGNPTPTLPHSALMQKNATLRFVLVYDMPEEAKQQATADQARFQATGKPIHAIGARFRLEQVAAAHETIEQHKHIGNVVISVAER